MQLRVLGLKDDLDAYNVGNEVWPGVEFIRERTRSMPKTSRSILLGAELDGVPAGFLMIVGLPIRPGGRGFGYLHVNEWARRRGVGSALRKRMTECVAELGLPGVVMTAPDDPAALSAVQAWGFSLAGRHYESELDLTCLDLRVVAEAVRAAAAAGVSLELLGSSAHVQGDIDGLSEGVVDEAKLRAVYPFFVDRFREAPDSEGSLAPMPFEIFTGFVGAPWRVMQAFKGGELVGVTGVAPRASGTVNTFFTGVHPDHRGQGIAVALKAAHAQILKDRGLVRVVTQNMDSNAPILAANARLGFRRVSAYVDVLVDLPSPVARPAQGAQDGAQVARGRR